MSVLSAALFVGRGVGRSVLVEIVEIKPGWYHYSPFDLDDERQLETKTIGCLDWDRDAHQPPSFVQEQFRGLDWRRLR